MAGTTDLETAVDGANLVIEAVPEKLELKRDLFSRIREWSTRIPCSGRTPRASVWANRRGPGPAGSLVGLRFFNPVRIRKLLEVISHPAPSGVIDQIEYFGAEIDECIYVKDFPGFATSRLGVCLGMEAIRMFEQGVASAADIDTAMVPATHPVGPLKLTDMVGLDVRMHIGEYLAEELGNPAFKPPALMVEMVESGKLGKKSGQGFYDWD